MSRASGFETLSQASLARKKNVPGPTTSWAGQELFEMVISPRHAEFFKFGLQNLTRDLERTYRGNPGHASILFCFFAHLLPIFFSFDFSRGSYVEVKKQERRDVRACFGEYIPNPVSKFQVKIHKTQLSVTNI